jgi:hypothetical protein
MGGEYGDMLYAGSPPGPRQGRNEWGLTGDDMLA